MLNMHQVRSSFAKRFLGTGSQSPIPDPYPILLRSLPYTCLPLAGK